jgi:succinate dehydrogenase/fumarate reductase cytochrome b subunit
MFIWLFHRLSGLLLVLLFGLKIATGFFLYTKGQRPEWALMGHRQPLVDVLILVLFTFHSLYGIRAAIMDLGFRREKLLFWWSNLLGAGLSLALVALYLRVTA